MSRSVACRFAMFAVVLVWGEKVSADEPASKPVKELILPGESFLVEDRPAFIFWPAEEKRTKPQPWVMYAPTLPAYPDSHEKWMHEQFVAAGVAVAGIDANEAYGSPHGQKLMSALYAELTEKRGFARKPCLLGRSRGGLWVSSWAIAHPDKVAGIAGIYPVYDLRTYPGLERAAPAYGMTATELAATLDRHNPIARIDVLAKAKIPVAIIHGDVDTVVPLKENSQTLAERYQAADAADAVKLIVVEGQGHNFWPGFFRCQELVDFSIARAKAGAMPQSQTAAPAKVQRLGGWANAPAMDKDVIQAAQFAIQAQQQALQAAGEDEKLTLVQIVSAQKQVVQGMNYKLTLQVKLGEVTKSAEAVVWVRLWLKDDERYQLTSWKLANAK